MPLIGYLPPQDLSDSSDSFLKLWRKRYESASTCHYCGGSGLGCCEHSGDSVAELNKRVREGAD